MGPCYPSAVHNVKHIGDCVGQLVNRILDSGTENIHLIGFSLGAQVTNYAAKAVAPFRLPRITGLDPAMPLFITSGPDDKLDASDADFVDVIHTNALVQVRYMYYQIIIISVGNYSQTEPCIIFQSFLRP